VVAGGVHIAGGGDMESDVIATRDPPLTAARCPSPKARGERAGIPDLLSPAKFGGEPPLESGHPKKRRHPQDRRQT